MNYNVIYEDVDLLNQNMQAYQGEVSAALGTVDNAVARLAALSSFQGAAADSAKTYYQEVHGSVARLLDGLVAQLSMDYTMKYMSEFSAGDINENHSAKLPELKMEDTEGCLEALRTSYIEPAEEDLASAMAALPSGFEFTKPSASTFKSHVEETQGKIETLRTAVSDLEAQGKTAFSSSSDSVALMQQMEALLPELKSRAATMATYESGSATRLFKESGALDTYFACMSNQEKNYESFISEQNASFDRQNVRIEERIREEEEKKKKWAIVGTVASVLVFVSATAALVATAGAATPAIFALKAGAAGYSMYKAGKDMSERAVQLVGLHYDSRLDKDDLLGPDNEVAKEIGDNVSTVVKDGSKVLQYKYDDAKYVDHRYNSRKIKATQNADEGMSKLEIDEYKVKGIATGYAEDFIHEKFVDEVAKKDGETAAWVDGVWEVSDSIKDSWAEYRINSSYGVTGDAGSTVSGFVGSVGKGTEAVADYYVDQADQQLDKLDDQAAKVEELRENLGNRQQHTWSCGW